MTTASMTKTNQRLKNALEVPKLRHAEAGELAATEAERVLNLIESL